MNKFQIEKIKNIIKLVDSERVVTYIYIDEKYFTYEYGLDDLSSFLDVNESKLVLDYYYFEYDGLDDCLEIKIYTKKLNMKGDKKCY